MANTTKATASEAQKRQREARDYWTESYRSGYPLSGAELAERFGRSERWGLDRIKEARAALAASSPVRLPGEVELDGLPPITPPQSPVAETAAAPSGPQDRVAETAAPAESQSTATAETAETITPPQSPVAETAAAPSAPQSPVAETAETTTPPQSPVAETATPKEAPSEPQDGPKRVRVWPVWILMLPASVAIWGGWVGLGEMAGFGVVNLLPGIANVEVNTAITLPIGMEVYAAYALYVWLSGRAQGKAKAFAKRSAITSLVVGALGQIAYHVMAAAGVGVAPWWITAAVACLPVAVLGMGAALAHMVRAEE